MPIHSSFSLSQTSGKPMYLQIMEQVRRKVAVGDWPAGAEIPSIRQLAADLSVSVITVKRAYQELEQEGLIVTQQGRGSFVSHNPAPGAAQWEEQLTQALQQAAQLGKLLGLADAALIARMQETIDNQEEA
jgi:GntR family transcriptional regulator